MTDYTATQKRSGLNNMNAYAQRAQLGDLVYGAASGGYPLDYPGLIYYVNNVTGSSGNSGLTWDDAFAQPSQAITAWNTAQALLADIKTRGIIFIAGTLTAYTGLTALPEYCDLVGVGSNPLGNGPSVPRIGSDSAAEDGVLVSGTIRGLNCYNLQFQAGTAKSCFSIENLYKSGFYNCAFMVNGVAASCTTGFTAAKLSGVTFLNCHWGTASNVEPTVGIDITGTHFHHCVIENCKITGITAGFRIASGTTSNYGSIVKNCIIASDYGTLALGIDDNATVGQCIYAGNYIAATKSNELANNNTLRFPGNYVANGFAAVA